MFTGIGGLDLGLEETGVVKRWAWQCEKSPAALRVLERRFPGVKRYTDVREIDATVEKVDIICGGFPCQDTSQAAHGRSAGMLGLRSGLWRYMWRAVRDLQPAYVFVEHPTSGLSRWIGTVLGDLASLRYDAEWDTVTAHECGAPHLRERTFVLARNPNGYSQPAMREHGEVVGVPEVASRRWSGRVAFGGPLRMAHGLPSELDQLRMLGNACVPSQAALAFRRLIARYRGYDLACWERDMRKLAATMGGR